MLMYFIFFGYFYQEGIEADLLAAGFEYLGAGTHPKTSGSATVAKLLSSQQQGILSRFSENFVNKKNP